MARDGGGTSLHDYQSPCDVGNMRRFERGGFTSECQRIGGKNGIACAGDVNRLIAAMNGNVGEPIIGFKERCAVAPASNEEGL